MIRQTARWLIFPCLFFGGIGLTWWLMQLGTEPLIAAYGVLVGGMVTMTILEHALPYRAEWNTPQGDIPVDMMHALISYILIPIILKPLYAVLWFAILVPLTGYGLDIWPTHWPIVLQLALALLAADAGRYWGHRLAHEVPFLWRFHAVHHSPKRLWWMNAMRAHPVDIAWFLFTETILLIILGATGPVLALYLVAKGFHGFFQHTNIDVKMGPLNYVFNAAELHRWHHAIDPKDSDHNYGNNLIVYDILFGTRYLPKEDVDAIGLLDKHYPTQYWQQLLQPFRRALKNDGSTKQG